MVKQFYETLRKTFDDEYKMAESSAITCGKEVIQGFRARRIAFLDAVLMIDRLYETFDPGDWDESEDMNG